MRSLKTYIFIGMVSFPLPGFAQSLAIGTNQAISGTLTETTPCATGNFSVAARIIQDNSGNFQLLATEILTLGANGTFNTQYVLFQFSTSGSVSVINFVPTPTTTVGTWSGSAQSQGSNAYTINLSLTASQFGQSCSATLQGTLVSTPTGL